jgi:hypothetical protein
MTTESGGQEVYSTSTSTSNASVQNQPIETVAVAVVRPNVVEEEEDLNVLVSAGTTCKHNGCNVLFVGDEVNRIGDGEGTICIYHPSPVGLSSSVVCECFNLVCPAYLPGRKQGTFHRGSNDLSINLACQGYLCCKRRVLEFEEFLKIEGCKTGRHLFAIKDVKTEVCPQSVHATNCSNHVFRQSR